VSRVSEKMWRQLTGAGNAAADGVTGASMSSPPFAIGALDPTPGGPTPVLRTARPKVSLELVGGGRNKTTRSCIENGGPV